MPGLRELIVKVSADVTRLNKGMDRAERKVGKAMGAIRKAALAAGAAIASIGAVRGISRLITQSIDAADAIGKQARAVGLSAEAFQKLAFAADKASISQDSLKSNLTAFIKRVGELQTTGIGPLGTFLDKYNVGLKEAIANAPDQEAALRLVAEAMQQAATDTEAAAIANAAFSRAGVDMTLLLRDGVGDLERWGNEAERLGIIISDELVAGAEDAKDKLSILADVIRVKVTDAVVRLAPRIAELTDKIIALFEVFIPEKAGPLAAELLNIESRIKAINAQIERLSSPQGGGAQANSDLIGGLRAERERLKLRLEFLKAMAEEEENLNRVVRKGAGAAGLTAAMVKELDAAKKKAKEDMAELRLILSTESIKGAGVEDTTISLYRAMEEQFERMEQKARESFDYLEEEGSDAADSLADTFKGVGKDIESAITNAATASQLSLESLADFAKSVFDSIARRLTSKFIAGPIGEFIEEGIGDIFGGGKAAGGPVSAGRAYLVGERGPELFVPRGAGEIVPSGAFGGGAVNVNFTVVANDAQSFRQSMAQNRDLVVGMVRSGFRRGGSDPRIR